MNQAQAVPTTEKLQIQFPLCVLSVRIEQMAADLGATLQQWIEPGMGPATGFACQLPSGQIVFIEQFLHARELEGGGPSIYVEAADLAQRGADAVIQEVLPALGQEESSLSWRQTDEGNHAAEQIVRAHAVRSAAYRPRGDA